MARARPHPINADSGNAPTDDEPTGTDQDDQEREQDEGLEKTPRMTMSTDTTLLRNRSPPSCAPALTEVSNSPSWNPEALNWQ